MVGRPITATLTDDDSPTSAHEWQWQKSMTPMNMNSWMDATGSGATTATYTPVAADANHHLRATVTYTDNIRSGRTAYSDATTGTVDPNAAPAFSSETATREVPENSPEGTDVGAPVTAMDPGDTLTYSLGGDDAASFSINSETGQLMTMAALDHETKDMYMVTVMATDSAGESDSIMVTINVTDANDAPMFADATATREVAENTAAGMNIGDMVTAMDQDGDMLTYSLDETGAMYFGINSETGQLMTMAALDHETKDMYMVTVMATDIGWRVRQHHGNHQRH